MVSVSKFQKTSKPFVLFLKLLFQDLLEELKSELDGDLENAVVAMMLPNDVFYASELNKAMKV